MKNEETDAVRDALYIVRHTDSGRDHEYMVPTNPLIDDTIVLPAPVIVRHILPVAKGNGYLPWPNLERA
jgi:hypothetical protein